MNTIGDWMESWEEDEYLHATLLVMREIVLKQHPDIVEVFKWKVPYYVYKGHLLYISVLKKKIPYFSFCHGFQLADEEGLFTGLEKKAVRYLEISPNEDIDIETVEKYIQKAIIYNDNFPNFKFGQASK